MTVADAAKLLEIKPATVYALCAAGEIDHLRMGVGRGVIRIEPGAVEAYREKSRVRAKPKPVMMPGHKYRWVD